ncbi:MAG: hypothetical protein J6386_08155 [Candidatus Synoicihabitans palmerolidicus]|nr:hypothetical protein [Candidatus Synoicihabitans palmerolidicus]
MALKTKMFTTAKLLLSGEGKKFVELRHRGATAYAISTNFTGLVVSHLDGVDADATAPPAKTKKNRHEEVMRITIHGLGLKITHAPGVNHHDLLL